MAQNEEEQPPESDTAQIELPVEDPRVYLLIDERRPHPDGFVGQVAFNSAFRYVSISGDPSRSVNDLQHYRLGLDLVADSRVTLLSSFKAVDQDTTYYELMGGLRVYTRDPANRTRSHNPDGPVGGPVLTAMAGTRFSSDSNGNSAVIADIRLMLPVSRRLTIGAGYRYYETLTATDVDEAFGSISYYTGPYLKDSAYANPDGPVGNLALRLSGGGSAEGAFGELSLIFPISGNLSLVATGRGERVEFPYQRSVVAGAGFRFYPSN